MPANISRYMVYTSCILPDHLDLTTGQNHVHACTVGMGRMPNVICNTKCLLLLITNFSLVTPTQVDKEARKKWDVYATNLEVIDRDPHSGTEVVQWIMRYPVSQCVCSQDTSVNNLCHILV